MDDVQPVQVGGRARKLSRWDRTSQRLRPLWPALAICAVGLLPFRTCLLQIFFHTPCPACGLTRAGLRLLSLDLAGATHFQPLAIPLFVLFLTVLFSAPWLSDLQWKWIVQRASTIAGIGLIAVWALRFVGFFGGPVP